MWRLACGLALLVATWAPAADEGLVGHWRFDSAGPQVRDLSGRGHEARLTGGQVLSEGETRFLRMDGQTRLEVPPAPELSLRRGFAVELKVRPSRFEDGRVLVFKDGEYLLRVDWPNESSRLSWFVNFGEGWEPRASAPPPPLNAWQHLVAVWDGVQLTLWLNGLPHTRARHGQPPPPGNSPLLIGSDCAYGRGFVGDVEYVKLYGRALTTAEVLKTAYGLQGGPRSPRTAETRFDFRRGTEGWCAQPGATAQPARDGLVVTPGSPLAGVMHDHLDVDLAPLDYLTVRMAVDRGNTATLVYITSTGAGRIPFATMADGQPHTYLLEPWEQVGWGGKLVLLGLIPSDEAGAIARVQYLRVTPEPEGEGELALSGLTTDATLPRAGRPERMTVRVRNTGGPAREVRVTLQPGAGLALAAPATQVIPALGYGEEKELGWTVRARQATAAACAVTARGTDTNQARIETQVRFLPELKLPRAGYVPEPRPLDTGPYTLWTHYCPLWKHGTHQGWKAIEPWPERKPVLGWYDEGTPEVADWHIKYLLEHGISGLIYCWYRTSINRPVTQSLGHAIHDGLLRARYLDMIKFGIMWENGCGQGVGSAQDLLDNVLPYWLDNYFTHPSYAKIDGKPVLYVWVPGNVTKHLGSSEKVRETFDLMRQKCRERGLAGLYLVGCCGGADRAALERMKLEGWDATSAYGNGWRPPEGTRRVGEYLHAPAEGFAVQQEAIWQGKQEVGALPDITAAMMGWDARPWKSSSFYWSDNTPEKFRDLCRRAKAVMDGRPGNGPERTHLIFCCWNEFGEGHYIEPTRGYGFSYLDVVRETFGQGDPKHEDLAPEDVGLGPYDSWYRTAKQAGLERASQLSAWSGSDLGQWTGMMGTKELAIGAGTLRFVTTTRDPALSSPALRLRGGRFSRFVVEMRVSEPGRAQVFWTTPGQPQANESASAVASVPGDGLFHRMVFEVGTSELWGGCITGFRFDPTDQAEAVVEIRSIALE